MKSKFKIVCQKGSHGELRSFEIEAESFEAAEREAKGLLRPPEEIVRIEPVFDRFDPKLRS